MTAYLGDAPADLTAPDQPPHFVAQFELHWHPLEDPQIAYGPFDPPGDRPRSHSLRDGFSVQEIDVGDTIEHVIGPILEKILAFDPVPAEVKQLIEQPIPFTNETLRDLLD